MGGSEENPKVEIVAYIVRFKREEKSKWENGIALGPTIGDITVIIDSEYKVVTTPVWNFSTNAIQWWEGLIRFVFRRYG